MPPFRHKSHVAGKLKEDGGRGCGEKTQSDGTGFGWQISVATGQDVTSIVGAGGTAYSAIAQRVEMIAQGNEQTHASMADSSENAKNLSHLAHSLQASVEHFRLPGERWKADPGS